MSVSSPYAVFTAAELGWAVGPSPRPSKRIAAPVSAQANTVNGVNRRSSGRLYTTGAIGGAMVQGELFQLA